MAVTFYDVGDTVRLTSDFALTNGSAADPSEVTLRVRTPGGETTLYEITSPYSELVRDAVGSYHCDLAITEAGTWAYRWQGTGTVATVEEGQLYVRRSKVI